jgi:hypothetical protein
MLILSDGAAKALQEDGLRVLRQKILDHWFEQLRGAGETLGDQGREAVIAEVLEMSRADPALTQAELVMYADLRLVDLALERRRAH